MRKVIEYGEKEISYLCQKDEKMARLIEKAGHIHRDGETDLFASLTDSIVGQQISTAAHNTIRNRINEKFGILTPEKVMATTDDELKSVGISYRKVGYIKDFSSKVINGEIDIEALYTMSDEDAVKELVKVKGVGVWTAEMMLTFCLQRPDVLSYGDLAIRRGIMKLYGLEELSVEDFHRITDKFSPYRTVAALYFWHYANPKCDFTI
ncbi:MAG: DNA-3-methyladenine glycosylase 2 family protein [Oscillospiraceae bacterium]|nr:DNA-3-methyladenine glycosylase 2 family protein [Oscillospiraceae bacterium]